MSFTWKPFQIRLLYSMRKKLLANIKASRRAVVTKRSVCSFLLFLARSLVPSLTVSKLFRTGSAALEAKYLPHSSPEDANPLDAPMNIRSTETHIENDNKRIRCESPEKKPVLSSTSYDCKNGLVSGEITQNKCLIWIASCKPRTSKGHSLAEREGSGYGTSAPES